MSVQGIEVFDSDGVTFTTFDPSWFGVYAQPISGGTRPLGPDEVLAASRAAAILNGSMFHNCSGQNLPSGNAAYAVSQCARSRFGYADQARGLYAPGTDSADAGISIGVSAGRAWATPAGSASAMPSDASVSVQLYPALVAGGNVVASNTGENAERVYRAGVAVMNDGRIAFAAGPMDMISFANALANAGATDAGYTDGGGSTSLWLSDGQQYGSTEGRRVATWLVASPPGTVVPVTGSTSSRLIEALVAAGVAAAAVGAIWIATRPAPPPRSLTRRSR